MFKGWVIWSAVLIAASCLQSNKAWMFERKRPLAIPGAWSAWGSWSSCAVNSKDGEFFYPDWEDFIVQMRNRTCSNPAPLFGGDECVGAAHRFKQCSCENPLGMGNRRIRNSQLSASSEFEPYFAFEGRLGANFSGWCSGEELSILSDSYLQIDFQHFLHVAAIATEGTALGRVRRYRLDYSLDGKIWNSIYRDLDGRVDIFSGNILPGSLIRNDFHQHVLVKHLRVKPASGFGKTCMKAEIYGCAFSCGDYLNSPVGVIFGQSSEAADRNCLWKVHVLNTTSLTFNFQSFFVLCQHGYLDFHDGSSTFGEAPLIRRICLQSNEDEVDVFTHFGNSVWLNFVSNSSSPDVSFQLNYFSSCKQEILLVAGVPVTISSPNYPERYFDNSDCLWDVTLPKGISISEIQLNLDQFGIEGSSKNVCSSDYLFISTVVNGTGSEVGYFCNTNVPPAQLQLQADSLKIIFKSDSYISDVGFRLLLVAGRPLTSSRPDFRSSDYTSTQPILSTVHSQDANGTSGYPQLKRKLSSTNDSDDTWTVVTVSAFSALVFVLLVAVAAMNIRRFVLGRNEVSAQCAKLAAEEKQKKRKKLAAANNSLRREQLELLLKRAVDSPSSPNAPGSSILVEAVSCNSSPTYCQVENCAQKEALAGRSDQAGFHDDGGAIGLSTDNSSEELVSRQAVPPDGAHGADDHSSYDSSSPQIHSPMNEIPEVKKNLSFTDSSLIDNSEHRISDRTDEYAVSDFDAIVDASESIV